MDSVLYASMDVVKCNMPCVYENAPMCVNPQNCDDMLHESMVESSKTCTKHL